MKDVINHKCAQKMRPQNKKLMEWLKHKKKPTKRIPNFVQNISSHSFSKPETDLLENGLKYAIHQKQPNLKEIAVDVKSFMKGLQYVKNENIRRKVKATLKAHTSKPVEGFEAEKEAITLLLQKDCYFFKADKGNLVMILDKSHASRNYWMKVLTRDWK
jgi:hypothetical protein